MRSAEAEVRDIRIILCVIFERRARPGDVAALKRQLTSSEECLESAEVTGTFDFMLELAVDDFASYGEWLARFAEPFASLVNRYEVNFVCNRVVHERSEDSALWVPSQDGLERVDCSTIDKITAEGDYVRLHSNGHSWLFHATMRSIAERLEPDEFVQIHRSTIVRRDFVDRLVHKGRNWVAKLHDGSAERIAKSHVSDTMNALRSNSAMTEAD
jgi:DNA-binding LytR/AlgR family response regulator